MSLWRPVLMRELHALFKRVESVPILDHARIVFGQGVFRALKDTGMFHTFREFFEYYETKNFNLRYMDMWYYEDYHIMRVETG